MKLDRRLFIKRAACAAALAPAALAATPALGEGAAPEPFAVQQYTWYSYTNREGFAWMQDLDASFGRLAAAGLRRYEPSFDAAEQVKPVAEAMQRHGIAANSMYVGATLHEAAQAEAAIEAAVAIARAARPLGIRTVVSNPSPIRWGGPENKTDAQLAVQAEALDRLGRALRAEGMTLAYHNHDPEMRAAAREFHHMMLGTDPENVRLCLDAHWIYRGAENSQTALFDIVRHYGPRIVEVHIRQSQGGVWSEVFGEGDLDYPRLAAALAEQGLRPNLVLEQAVEAGTPSTRTAEQALQQSMAAALEAFRPLVG